MAERYLKSPLPTGRGGLSAHLAAVGLVAAATLLCEQARPYLSPVNMVMAYLLAVVLAAVSLGRWPAIVTAFLGVVAFDFFFVPPRFSFTISDKEYLFTFLALFTVGLVISTLMARAGERLEALSVRELQTATLYRLSRKLAAAGDTSAVVSAVVTTIQESMSAKVLVLLQQENGLTVADSSEGVDFDEAEQAVAQWCLSSNRMAGPGTQAYSSARFTYLALRTPEATIGVLGIRLPIAEDTGALETCRLLESFATQTAMALERVRLFAEAQQAQILKGRENLERALLNSISHDLRTPLAAITGALSAVLNEGGKLGDTVRAELLLTAREEAGRLDRFVGNLLDMTRLESGALRPRLEPSDVQDLVGCALAAVESRLGGAAIEVRLAPDLPLAAMDLVLMIQVLVNLLDNALKYSPPGGKIEISSHASENLLILEVADRGPGLPEQELDRIFEKFYRTAVPERVAGTGLGLSICKGIVEAHGGSIEAQNRDGGGLRVIVSLPLETPKKEALHGE